MAPGIEGHKELQKRMLKLGVTEDDLVEKFVLGSGTGGQKINKTSSCVYIKHLPTGIEVKCQKGRSREANRLHARMELCSRIEEILFKEKREKQQAREKIRRQNRRPTAGQKEKMLEQKLYVSKKKTLRRKPSLD